MKNKVFIPLCMIVILLLFSGCVPGYSQYKNQKEAEAAAEEARQAAEEYADEVAEQMEEMKNQAEQQAATDTDTTTTDTGSSDETGQETDTGSGSDTETAAETAEEEEQTDKLGRQYAEVSEDYDPDEIITYELTDAQLASIKEKVTKGVKSSFLTSTYPTGIKVGESHVFAFGMTNMGIETRDYRYEARFRRAKDMNNNAINDIDEETIAGWISANDFEDRTLESYEQVFLPVGVTAKEEIGPGMPTIAGTYYFLMEIFYKDGSRWVDYDSKEFSVRVK